MRFDRLILKDFLTYENLDYHFENRPLLIQGLNLTDDGQTTNGTGKSGLQTGIEQCITASNSRDVRDNEIITYGKKMANAQLYTSCDVRKETLHIDWDIKLSGSNVLRLKVKKYSEVWDEEGDSQDVSFSNVNDGKKAIMDWFAISKEDLFNYYIINNTRFKSFFKSSNTDKVALINRFSDASIIEGIEKIDTKELDLEYKNTQTSIDETRGRVSLIEEHITIELSRNLEKENTQAIEKIDNLIEETNEEIFSLLKEIKDIEKTSPLLLEKIKEEEEKKEEIFAELLDLKKEKDKETEELDEINVSLSSAKKLVDEFNSTDWNLERFEFKNEIGKSKKELPSIKLSRETSEAQNSKILSLLRSIDVKLSGAITCPKCTHSFVLGEESIPQLEEKKVQIEGLKVKVLDSIKNSEGLERDIKEKINELEESISLINVREGEELELKSKLQNSVNLIYKKVSQKTTIISSFERSIRIVETKETSRLSRIDSFNSSILKIDSSVLLIHKEIDSYKKDLIALEDSKLGLKIGSNKEQVKVLESNLEALNSSLEGFRKKLITIGDQIYEINQWVQNFKQFRMHLANQSLEVIEYHCNRYLQEMNSDLVVKIEGFKIKADNTVKEEINATIVRGHERTFSSFSGGERGRLLFACILANRHMINETHPYGGLDFLGVDEVFEGVDAAGLVSLINSAKLLNIPVMIITHVSVEESSENVLTIIKENDVSYIKK
jgi:DNA repair exonuclease SbcCD ATPase subunit